MNKKYKFVNNLTTWIVFLIAAITYISTAAPTASFWDCGEFIASAYKFEVGHPPGAPVFMLLAKFFSLFTFGDVTKVAFSINILSALCSAFTILFLFRSITHIARKILIKNSKECSSYQLISIMGAGVVGALAYAFSDSFWFSAVEGEVYAMSSLFTAAVFWLILKWESVADEPHAIRWLILIAYLMGLSIGVHLLNLLAIPAMVFVYYFKSYTVTKRGVVYASIVSLILLGAVMYGIIPYTLIIASWFELLFVNGMGAPYNTGVLIYGIILISSLVYGIYYTHKHKKVVLNVILLSVTVIMIGYSSFAIVVIRANADTPMDENNPDNVFSLLSYLNRDQYGSRPLFKGQYFNSPVMRVNGSASTTGESKVYSQIDGKYKVTNTTFQYEYDPNFTTLFPRMYSSQAKHIPHYKTWSGFDGTNGIPIKTAEGKILQRPTFFQNLKYFFDYQIGWMYMRYFMWNFAGRQNEIQGHGNVYNGNWISGITFIDEYYLGPQDNLPDIYKNNKARNEYYMLPLLLGLLGMVYLLSKDKKDFIVVGLLFILTGLAIVVYLNQPPVQPRERDYAYVGSFYAFAIWIGLGVLGLSELIQKFIKNKRNASIIATVLSLVLVPGLMASQNYDDHDRSQLYAARDFAMNYLESCEKDAILFTNGDNDTFPLWYVQEVEGFRTDVRVCNLSLLQTDWYIDQMKRQAYDSDALPISMKKHQYIQGTRDVVYISPRTDGRVDLKLSMGFVKSDRKGSKLQTSGGDLDYFPSRKLFLKVNKENVLANNTKLYQGEGFKHNINLKDSSRYLDRLEFNLKGNYIGKNHLVVLDMLQQNDWKRPIYYANSMGQENYLGLEKYFQTDGLTYRIVPLKSKPNRQFLGRVDVDILYNNVMKKFRWGGLDTDKDIFINENNARMVRNMQNIIIRLARELTKKAVELRDSSYLAKAEEALDKAVLIAPNKRLPYNYINMLIGEEYYRADIPAKGDREMNILAKCCVDRINYFRSFPKKFNKQVSGEIQQSISILYNLLRIANKYKRKELVMKYNPQMARFMKLL